MIHRAPPEQSLEMQPEKRILRPALFAVLVCRYSQPEKNCRKPYNVGHSLNNVSQESPTTSIQRMPFAAFSHGSDFHLNDNDESGSLLFVCRRNAFGRHSKAKTGKPCDCDKIITMFMFV